MCNVTQVTLVIFKFYSTSTAIMGCANASKGQVCLGHLSITNIIILPLPEKRRKEREKRKALEKLSSKAKDISPSQSSDSKRKHSTVPKTPLLTTGSARIKTAEMKKSDSVSGQSKPTDSTAFGVPPMSSVRQPNEGTGGGIPPPKERQRKSARPSESSASQPLSTAVECFSSSNDSRANVPKSSHVNPSEVKTTGLNDGSTDGFLSNDARPGGSGEVSSETKPSTKPSTISSTNVSTGGSVLSAPEHSKAHPSDAKADQQQQDAEPEST